MAQVDGTVIIDTKIQTDGMEKGFERLKTDAESLGVTCKKVGDQVKLAFSGADVSSSVANAVTKVQALEQKLAMVTQEFNAAIADDDDKAAAMWGSRRMMVYDQLETARNRLLFAVQDAAAREAAAEERAAAREAKAAKRAAAQKQREQEKQWNSATKGAKRFARRFTRILSGALVFNLLSRGLRQLVSYFGTALKKNNEFSTSFAQLKGAFLTAAQPIYEVLAPALTYLMRLLTTAMRLIGGLFSLIAGQSYSQTQKNASALYDQAKAIDSVGSAAKDAQKQLAGFDEINRMDAPDTGSGGGGSDTTAAKFDQSELEPIDLDKLIVYTAAGLLAMGVILAFSGANIPLGLGLIALGAVGLAKGIAENWGEIEGKTHGVVDDIMAIGSALMLVLGIILAFAVPGKRGLGIGLIIAGVVGLATVAALDWNSMVEKLQSTVGLITAIVSSAFLAIGAILTFAVPGQRGLGIGLIIAGAAGLATVAAVNWNSIVASIQGTVGKIIAIASGALLVLGVILTCCGILPLGIGLIIAGAAGLATVTALNWNSILYKIKGVWNSIKSFWNAYIAPVFTVKWWKDLAIKCGNGLISGFEAAINGIISLFETMINWVVGGLNKISFDVPDWVPGIGGKKFGFNLSEVSFGRVAIPRLAQGAVIPANHEFLAVLGDQKRGTNIEAPLETIQEAVALVMDDMINSNLAGQEAILGVLREILQAILGIEIGDDIIGRAVDRYNRKRAVMRGV